MSTVDPRARVSQWQSYTIAIVSVAVAWLIYWRLNAAFGETYVTVFVAAVALSCWVGTWITGLLCTAVAALVLAVVLPPAFDLHIDSAADAARLGVFVFTALFVVALKAIGDQARLTLDGVRQELQTTSLHVAAARSRERLTHGLHRQVLLWYWEIDLEHRYISYRAQGSLGEQRHIPLDRWLAGIHPDDRKKVTEALARVAESRDCTLEYRVRRTGGGWRRFTTRGVLLENAAGRRVAGVTLKVLARRAPVEPAAQQTAV